MLILSAILFASALFSTLEASAIKGHLQRPHQDELARSIKLNSPSSSQPEKEKEKKAPLGQQVPILESTKKIYNDETIRRLASAQAAVEPIKPVVEQQQQQQQQQAPLPVPAVVQPAPVPVVQAVPEQVKEAPIEPKSAPVEKPVEKPAEKAAKEELPAPSDRSAAIKNELPVPVVQPEQAVVAQAPAEIAKEKEKEKEKESPLMGKKEEPVAASASGAQVEPLHIEVPAPDPGLVLSEPIDSTTKLLIDLDEHVQKFLPVEDQQQPAQPHKDQSLVPGVDYSPPAQAVPAAAVQSPAEPSGKSGPLVPYSGAEDPIVPPLPSLDGVEKASAGSSSAAAAPVAPVASSAGTSSATRQGGQNQNQQQVITQLLDQLDSLQNRIQDTINQLVARRRYVMSALLRPMGTYVRRVRTNLERLQNRVNQLQAAAVSVGGGGGNRPGGFVDAAAIETIRRRIDDISKRISDIVNRIRFSLTPTSAPLNSNGK